MRSFNDFSERMEHEFRDLELSLIVFGFKVDGEGLKKYCKLNELKSVDYIYKENNKFYLIEFSDLATQRNDNLKNIDYIKSSLKENKALLKKQKETEYNEINRELVQKYKDTLIIASTLKNYLSDFPSDLRLNKYCVIYAPFHKEVEENRKVEITRFLDMLQSKITQAIPDEIFCGVKVIPIEKFASPNVIKT